VVCCTGAVSGMGWYLAGVEGGLHPSRIDSRCESVCVWEGAGRLCGVSERARKRERES